MLSTQKIVLLSAVPLEIINFFVVGYPAGSQSVSAANQYPAVALQWYVLHLAGIVASDRSVFLRRHDRLDSLVLFLAGYVGTAVLLALAVWFVRLVLTALHKLSSPMRHAH